MEMDEAADPSPLQRLLLRETGPCLSKPLALMLSPSGYADPLLSEVSEGWPGLLPPPVAQL